MQDVTGFQRDLLYELVHMDDPSGTAIKSSLEDHYGEEIHHGRLYPNLDTLKGKGFIEKGEKDKRTNYYTITRRGKREIKAHFKKYPKINNG